MKKANPKAKQVRRQVVLNFEKPNGRAWLVPDPGLPEKTNNESKNPMKAPGKRAEKRGTKLKRRAAVQVICYPVTRLILFQASRMVGRSLSSFLILAGLKEAAAIKGVQVEDLIPYAEYRQYR